jgi:hypothetical protein
MELSSVWYVEDYTSMHQPMSFVKQRRHNKLLTNNEPYPNQEKILTIGALYNESKLILQIFVSPLWSKQYPFSESPLHTFEINDPNNLSDIFAWTLNHEYESQTVHPHIFYPPLLYNKK